MCLCVSPCQCANIFGTGDLSSPLSCLLWFPTQCRSEEEEQLWEGKKKPGFLAVGLRAVGRIHTAQMTSASILLLFQAPSAAAGSTVLPMSPCPSRPSVACVSCQQLAQATEGMGRGCRGQVKGRAVWSLLPAGCLHAPRAVLLLNSNQAMTDLCPSCHILGQGLLVRDIAVGRRGLFLSGLEDQ